MKFKKILLAVGIVMAVFGGNFIMGNGEVSAFLGITFGGGGGGGDKGSESLSAEAGKTLEKICNKKRFWKDSKGKSPCTVVEEASDSTEEEPAEDLSAEEEMLVGSTFFSTLSDFEDQCIDIAEGLNDRGKERCREVLQKVEQARYTKCTEGAEEKWENSLKTPKDGAILQAGLKAVEERAKEGRLKEEGCPGKEEEEIVMIEDLYEDYAGPVFGGPGLKSGTIIARTRLDASISKERDLRVLVLNWTKFLLSLGAILAVVALVWAGFQYVTAFGDDARIESAKKIVMWVVGGMLLIMGAYAIVNTIMRAQLGAGTTVATGPSKTAVGCEEKDIGGCRPLAECRWAGEITDQNRCVANEECGLKKSGKPRKRTGCLLKAKCGWSILGDKCVSGECGYTNTGYVRGKSGCTLQGTCKWEGGTCVSK